MEADRSRNPRANRDIEVDVGGFLNLLRADGGDDLGALLGRRRGGRRSRGVAGGGAGLAVLGGGAVLAHSVLGLRILHAVLAHAIFGLRIFRAVLAHAVLGLGILHAILATVLGLSVLRAVLAHAFLGLGVVHATLGTFIGFRTLHALRSAGIAVHRGGGRRPALGWGALLGGGTRWGVSARSGSLRISEPGCGDQCRRGHRDHKTISHGLSPHVLSLPAPTTKRGGRGSALLRVPSRLFCERAINACRVSTPAVIGEIAE